GVARQYQHGHDRIKKKAPALQHVNEPLLQRLHPEQIEVEICRSEELDRRRGLTSELDEMWSFVRSKANPRWLWHAIDHHTGKVLAYVFGVCSGYSHMPCTRYTRLSRAPGYVE